MIPEDRRWLEKQKTLATKYASEGERGRLLHCIAIIDREAAEVERLRLALRYACSPPWPTWNQLVDNDALVDTLMKFHLRQAAANPSSKGT
jgi:hypothetical protein